MPTRKGTASWEGTLKGGKGTFKSQSGLNGAYSFVTRFENQPGSNPEELIASAHAACYSMALSGALEKAGKPSTRIDTEAQCSVEPMGGGFQITTMRLLVKANVPGMDDATFQQLAAATKEGCPVSKALKGNVKMELDAQLM